MKTKYTRMPSVFVISSLLKTLKNFANYSNPSTSFENIKVSGIIPRFIPPKDNTELKQTFAQYGVNTPRSDSFGSNVRQRVNCLDATYVHDVSVL